MDHDVVGALMRSEQAAKRLKEMGLSEFGDWGHSWRFLKAAGQAVARDAEQRDAEHFLAVARDAWLHADLKVPPCPEAARIFVLPNPRSVAGRGFFADLQSAGIRLAFPLPSGD